MSTTTEVAWKNFTIRIPEDLHRALKVRTAEEGKTMSEVVERLIKQYLNGVDNRDGR